MRWRFRELDVVRRQLLRFRPIRAPMPNPESRRRAAVLVSLLNVEGQ